MNILEATENIKGQAYRLTELATKMQKVLYTLEDLNDTFTNVTYDEFEDEINNEEFYVDSIYNYSFEMTLPEFIAEASEEYYSKFLVKNAELIFNYNRNKVVARIYQDVITQKMSTMIRG